MVLEKWRQAVTQCRDIQIQHMLICGYPMSSCSTNTVCTFKIDTAKVIKNHHQKTKKTADLKAKT